MYNNVEVAKALGLCIEGLCEACDYRNYDAPFSCKYELMRNALALIKPRILTWDEAVLDEGRDVVYIEKKGDNIPEPGIVIIRDDKYAVFMSPLGDEEGCLEMHKSQSGLSGLYRSWDEETTTEYRFWSCKPSKKQMEDTPWEEQTEEAKECE